MVDGDGAVEGDPVEDPRVSVVVWFRRREGPVARVVFDVKYCESVHWGGCWLLWGRPLFNTAVREEALRV